MVSAAAGAELDALEASSARLETPMDDGRIVWRRWGAGPPVVLLHGGYGSWRHWVKTIPFLSRTHTLYVPDLPGLGDSSDVPRPASPFTIAAFLAAGIRLLVPGATPVQLVGFSFGAVIGGHLAECLGEKAAGLTLVGPAALGLARAPIVLEKWRAESRTQDIREIHRGNLAKLMIFDAGKVDELAVEIQFQNALRARLTSRKIVPPDALASALRRATPRKLCIIFGEHDAIVGRDMAGRAALMREIQPRADFTIIPGAGHWVAYEAPQAFNQALANIMVHPWA
jgi:pimeloyl-ACP methyl ester carboxylesterase